MSPASYRAAPPRVGDSTIGRAHQGLQSEPGSRSSRALHARRCTARTRRAEAGPEAGRYPPDVDDGDGDGDAAALFAAASCEISDATRFSAAAYAVRSPERSAFSASDCADCSCAISAVIVGDVPPPDDGGGVLPGVVGGDAPAAPNAVSSAAASVGADATVPLNDTSTRFSVGNDVPAVDRTYNGST